MFITFEGPEGGGKTTQIRLLAAALESRGYDLVVTREPGGTPLGDRLRSILLEEADDLDPATEALLMTGARARHVNKLIRPALQSGKLVICDRFSDSTLAYQGAGRGLDIARLECMQSLATDGIQPDLTLLLDVESRLGLQRRSDDGKLNRLDREPVEFHERVATWYRQRAQAYPARWNVIDASNPVDEVHAAVLDAVLKCLSVASRVSTDEG